MKNALKQYLIKRIKELLAKEKLNKFEEKLLDFFIDKFFDLEYGRIPTNNHQQIDNFQS